MYTCMDTSTCALIWIHDIHCRVTQMVVDRLCVVSSDTTMCKNQDVLFLGTGVCVCVCV